jgi:hypothetical protein
MGRREVAAATSTTPVNGGRFISNGDHERGTINRPARYYLLLLGFAARLASTVLSVVSGTPVFEGSFFRTPKRPQWQRTDRGAPVGSKSPDFAKGGLFRFEIFV